VTVIPPDPGAIVIEVVRRAASPGVTNSDALRWAGVAVAVIGAVLATPHGMASLWQAGRRSHRKALAFGKRLLLLLRRRRRQHVVGQGGVALGKMSVKASGYKWQRWLPLAGAGLKIEILHEQVDILLE
jgi:hypothetical protein